MATRKPKRAQLPYTELIERYDQVRGKARVEDVARLPVRAEELQAILAELPITSAPPVVQRLFLLAADLLADQERLLRTSAPDESVLQAALRKELKGVSGRANNKAAATTDVVRIRAVLEQVARERPHLDRNGVTTHAKVVLDSERLVRSWDTIYDHAKGLGRRGR